MTSFSRAIACARCWIQPSKVHFVFTCRSYTRFATSSETLCNPQEIYEVATGVVISRASIRALRRRIHPWNQSCISTNRSYTKFDPSSYYDQKRAVEEHSIGKENEDVNSSNASRGSLFSDSTFTSPFTPSWETSRSATKDTFSSTQYVDADDVEERLLRTDDPNFDHREGMDASGNGFNMDHKGHEGFNREGQPDRPSGGHAENGDEKEVADDDDAYDSDDSDDDMNVASDEEFEAEETDEELEELLANSPLMELPDPEDEGEQEYGFRPDGHMYYPGTEYEPEELDVTRPIEPKRRQPRAKVNFSVQEVIDKADFRNVRFLTRFIGETGNILARKQFKIRTKSHGRIIKAIKTARFFGLMPYTNMGKPPFEFNNPYDTDADFFYYSDEADEEGEYEGGQYSAKGGYAGHDGQVAGSGNGDGHQGEQGKSYHENEYNRGQNLKQGRI